jgi:uncharacterized protein (DUF433 family)
VGDGGLTTPHTVDEDFCERRSLMNDQWRSRITMEPGKRGGRPCIRGMRITVYDVLSYLAAGMIVAQVLDDFPYLTQEDIQACFAFAAERERSMLVAVG